MTEIVREPVDAAAVVVVSSDIELGERAHLNYGGILEAKCQVGRDFLVLGRLVKENRDKKYFKVLGYDTFEDFIGSPDVAMSRSMVFDLIRAVEVFIDKLARPMDELAEVGISKLSAIVPVVEKDPDEWMSKAKELSRSDLQEEVHEVTGKPYVRRSDAPRSNDQRPIGPGESYVDYVRESPCAICNKPATEGGKTNAAHFPVSRGAGAPADWVIPMCGDCHAEHHEDPVAFMTKYQKKWAAWFFRTIGMYDKALRDATGTTKLTLRPTTDTTELTLRDTTEHYEPLSLPPSALPSSLTPKPESLSVSEGSQRAEGLSSSSPVKDEGDGGEGAGSSSDEGSPSGSVSDRPVLDNPSSSPAELKQIWPPAGGFERCYDCHLVLPVADLEGGLCPSCRPTPVHGEANPDAVEKAVSRAADAAPASSDGLAFPKPVAAKRRGKKGGRK